MGIAEGMKDITENILNSTQTRAKDLEDLVEGNHRMFKEFAQDRKDWRAEWDKVRTEQAKSLADFSNSLAKDVSSTLKEFNKDREKMAEEMRDMFDKQRETTAKAVNDIKKDIHEKLAQFDKEHAEVRSDLNGAKKEWQKFCSVVTNFRKKGTMPKMASPHHSEETPEGAPKKRTTKKRTKKS